MKHLDLKKEIVVYPFVLIPVFVWIGFVCSISFMEAWLKFRAPDVTLTIGLNIGKLIFATLNKAEWSFAALIAVFVFIGNGKRTRISQLLFGAAVFILFLQTAFMLPSLNERADAISHGMSVPQSLIHPAYIICDVLKVVVLFVFGIITIAASTAASLVFPQREKP